MELRNVQEVFDISPAPHGEFTSPSDLIPSLPEVHRSAAVGVINGRHLMVCGGRGADTTAYIHRCRSAAGSKMSFLKNFPHLNETGCMRVCLS